MNPSPSLKWAAAFGATGIAIGALGAHALKSVLSPEHLNSVETAVRYQLFHALVLLVLGLSQKAVQFKRSLQLFQYGTLMFSGSIYLLILFKYFDLPSLVLVPITPLGGLLLIMAWLSLGLTKWTAQKG